MVHDTLLPFCSYLDWQPEPSVMQVANVQHLGTLMQGMLSKPFMHILDAAIMLSPTPALGGFPKHEALNLINQYEGIDRGRYGGAVGWFDQKGNGAFAVAIRCAQMSPNRTSLREVALLPTANPQPNWQRHRPNFRPCSPQLFGRKCLCDSSVKPSVLYNVVISLCTNQHRS